MDFEPSDLKNPNLLPLTLGQVSIWLAQLLDSSDPAFNIGEYVEICGALNNERFEQALRQAVKEADTLHLRVVQTPDGPRQYIGNDDRWTMSVVDFSSHSDPRTAAETWMREDMSQAFDLARGPLFRFALLCINANCYFWYSVNHHLVNDGFGWTLLLRRVAECYSRLSNGQSCAFERFASQDDLIKAEQTYRRSQHYARDRNYWLQVLKDRSEVSTLSISTPAVKSKAGVRQITGLLPGNVEIESLGRAYGSSAAAVVMAGIALYLHRVTGSHDIVLGMQVSARIGNASKRAVGMAANVIPLRLTVTPDEDFDTLLRRTARAMRDAFRHQLYRIEDLRRDLGLSPQTPDIFSVFANYMPLDDGIRFSDHTVRRFPLGNWRVEDIQFVYYGGSADAGYRIDAVANSAKYAPEQLDEHLHNLCALVSECATRPNTICGRFVLESTSDREQPLASINHVNDDRPDMLVHRLFEKQVKATPDAVAVSFHDVNLTYSELNRRANKLARCLSAEGVGPEVLVPVFLDQSVEMLVALLAVLKAGGAYVPINSALARSEIELLLQTIKPLLILTTDVARARLPSVGCKVIHVGHEHATLAPTVCTDVDVQPIGLTPNNLAYVIFGLDLTDQPKGTPTEHRGVVNRLQWMQSQYSLTGDDCVLQSTPFQLSPSVWELFWPLGVGAKLVIAKPHRNLEPEYLAQLIGAFGVTTAHFFPSALPSLLSTRSIDECRSLRIVFCSGEQLSPQLSRRLLDRLPGGRLCYLYGPTNGAFEAAYCEYSPGESPGLVMSGHPIANTEIHVLDDSMHPVPMGTSGEIYIGGVGIARRYSHRPEFIADGSVRSPFDPTDPAARLYRTGDFGRQRPDGRVEFLGHRHDLKIRCYGVCIDLNDIELFLKQIEGVKEVTVVVCEDAASKPQLLAYFTASETFDPSNKQTSALIANMRTAASARLPNQWQPSLYLPVTTFPLAVNGKVDRASLAARGWPRTQAAFDFAPLGRTESALHAIWRDVLRIEHFGRFDNFFDLGGHSLLATQVASRISRVFDVELALTTIFEAQTLEALARRIDEVHGTGKQLAASTRDQADYISMRPDRAHTRENSLKPVRAPIAPRTEDSQPALSHSQQRMWLIQSLDPDNCAYNLSGAVRFLGHFDADVFSNALDEVRRRHESLRSTFHESDGEVLQQIQPWHPQPLIAIDLRQFGDAAFSEGLRMAQAEARTPIDLIRGPVFRAALYRIAEEEHLLQLTVHHISGDQWSVGIVARELAMAYNALRAGKQVALDPIKLRYQDYAAWQRQHQHLSDRQLSYWREQLNGLASLELPCDFPRPQMRGLNGACHLAPLDASLVLKLDDLSKREGSTLFMTMLTAFALHLYRLTQQEDFAIGVPIANRTNSDLETLVGTFVNTLALRVDLSGEPSFLTLLKRIRAVALDGYQNQDVSFDKLVHDIAETRDNSRAPLVQVMFNMQNAPFYGALFDGLEWEPIPLDRGGAQFELSLSVDAQISNSITFEYNTDLFDRRTIKRFSEQYLYILEQIVSDPTQSVASTPMLPATERQLLESWNATGSPAGELSHFIAMFEQQVARAPDAPALSFDGQVVTYSTLNMRANAAAKALVGLGIKPGEGVAVCMSRSIDLVVLLLGIQKAGFYYIPLDPSFPKARLSYMLADSKARAVATDSTSRDHLVAPDGVLGIDASTLTAGSEATHHNDEFCGKSSGEDIAYIIYTSGSTGLPKGVVVGHSSLSNFLQSMARRPGLTDKDTMVAVTTISFDISGLELYLPLSVGACVELASKNTASDGAALSHLLAKSGATIMQATPATWRLLIDSGWKGDGRLRALSGGEALSRDLADALLDRVGELWNLYGPTETTIWSTAARIEPDQSPISIGRPIENTRVYIVDQNGELAPIGVPGEILIAGKGVAIGYHEQPERTAERFQLDHFVDRQGGRVYRTGDLGKWSSDGELFHLGRIDSQIKMRGFRIEIGEIEFVLRQHPAVAEAVVIARELSAADSRLIAYVQYGQEEATASELRNFLRNHLPDYMIPAVIVAIDTIPMTPNKKIDRSALPDPFTASAQAASEYVPPASAMERLVADIWQDLLQIGSVGRSDNFFELGGHSLLAVRMVGMIKQRTGRTLDPRTLYFKTLRQIAETVGRAK
ncbi:amino acid adenylation domain-containing protein [Bradyrhizobium sp. CIAT3101]|uniref:non-ribosomal peptide synthetase n=1 Tax=Bradyrhizobium sp. CIAT3101 TaxID=439387 RepID=UPI0024B12434|nr:non-ribosomal peptide synthetase [Bradyrhizobium sp. CIAT3101]WFU79155.1 amino acid adenylation domain-containing protein [Bradyrhizobium sp. CIAT3101]